MMKRLVHLLLYVALASPVLAQTAPSKALQLSLKELQAQAQKIARLSTKQGKAKAWLLLNREAVTFAEQLNHAFPHSRIHGDRVDPPAAQKLARQASSYGVRVDFCEPDAVWSASNEGYFKYLELWPDGPEADEATWMGPVGNQSGCGDFEGTADELQEIITKNQSFIAQFPNSRHTPEAKQRLADAEKMLADLQKSQRK